MNAKQGARGLRGIAVCACAVMLGCLVAAFALGWASSSHALAPEDVEAVQSTDVEENASLEDATGSGMGAEALADGIYQPECFLWSGGTGRLKGIDCARVRVEGGTAFATVVFQSPNYTMVQVGDVRYESLTPESDASTFEIPVRLNEDTPLSALTTAMSSEHWIEYRLYIQLIGENVEGEYSSPMLSENQESGLDDQAPDIPGFSFESELMLPHAQLAKVFQYERGVKLVEVDIARSAQGKPSSDQLSEAYRKGMVKYLLVPDGVTLPAGLEKLFIVVRLPVRSMGASSPQACKMLDRLAQEACLRCFDGSRESLAEAGLSQAADSGGISLNEADGIDYRALVRERVRLYVAALGPRLADAESLAALGAPLFVDRSADEDTDLAQADWLLVYGAVLGCPDEAARAHAERVAELTAGRLERERGES